MDQKWPNSDIQPQNSMSNTNLIHLKIIFYSEYWISRKIFIIAIIWSIHFWKTLSFKKGALFLSYHAQLKTSPMKKLFVYINFLGKNEHFLGWALLCSIRVVILLDDPSWFNSAVTVLFIRVQLRISRKNIYPCLQVCVS